MRTVLEEEMKMNSPQKTARVAACVFLGIFFLGMSTELFIRPGMLVSGDAAATFKNIADSESLFRLNEINHFAVLLLSSNADYLTMFKADQLHSLVMFFLELRKYGTYIPQMLSFWVLLLGYLVFKSGFLPRILGILLILGGLCYTVSAILFFLFPNLDTLMLGLFAFIGEALFYLWLLIKGVNVEEWKKRTLEA
jgi:hypothetical protein